MCRLDNQALVHTTGPFATPPTASRCSMSCWKRLALIMASSVKGVLSSNTLMARLDEEKTFQVQWYGNTPELVIRVPLFTAAKMAAVFSLGFVTVVVLLCWCWRCMKPMRVENVTYPGVAPERPVEVLEVQRPHPRKRRSDVGAQGPVHYDGSRYVHIAQGFRRGFEVTRTPHRSD